MKISDKNNIKNIIIKALPAKRSINDIDQS